MALSTNKMAFMPIPHNNKSPENVAWPSYGLQSINQFSTTNKTTAFSILFTSKMKINLVAGNRMLFSE